MIREKSEEAHQTMTPEQYKRTETVFVGYVRIVCFARMTKCTAPKRRIEDIIIESQD